MYNHRDPIKHGFLEDFYVNRKSVAVLLDNIDGNQVAFEAINSGFHMDDRNIDTPFFIQEWDNPRITLPSAVFHVNKLPEYSGHIICSSMLGVLDAVRLPNIKKILWFIHNPHEITMYHSEQVGRILEDKRIIKVCPNKDYLDMLKGSYPNATIEDRYCPHFDLNKLVRFIYKGKNK